METILLKVKKNVEKFESEAHQLFSAHEASPSRIISVDKSRKELKNLSLLQTELFEDSLKCVENKLYRAAFVMAWAGFIDFLEQKMSSDGLIKVKQVRINWSKYTSIEEIRENAASDYELIKVAKEIQLITKGEMKRLHGELSKRNDCAHPSTYNPSLNETLGYISGLINLIENIQEKKI